MDKLSRTSSDVQVHSTTLRDNELKLRQLSEENSNLARKVHEYEYQITTLSQEVQRFNNVLKQKMEEIGNLQQKNNNCAFQMEDAKRKIADLELKIQQLNRQIDLSKENLQRNAQFEIETLKRKTVEM